MIRKGRRDLGWAAELWESDWGIYRRNWGMVSSRVRSPVALPPATPPHLRMSSAWPPVSTSHSAGGWGNRPHMVTPRFYVGAGNLSSGPIA